MKSVSRANDATFEPRSGGVPRNGGVPRCNGPPLVPFIVPGRGWSSDNGEM